MSLSIAPFIVSLVLTDRIRRYVKVNVLQKWEKPLQYAIFFSVVLFVTEAILSDADIFKWIWHVFLLTLVIFLLRQKELRVLRMFIGAFVPYVIVSLVSDLSHVISPDFFSKNENYFNNATTLTFIWMVAILFSQNRQLKTAEKERIRRQKEDELNRAIAIRKVELEGLVAERTAELTAQKEELENTLHELRATQSQLIQSEKMASLGELTAGIAYEIQNPLNFVNNFSEVNAELIDEMKIEIEKGNLGEVKAIASDIAMNEKKISQHGKRADAIVKGMLQHSRASSGVKEPFSINELADEYLRLAYHGMRAKDKSFNVIMKTDFDETIGKISIIPQDIGRVILNLITNAFYAVTEKKQQLAKDLSGFESLSGQKGFEPTVWVSTKKTGNNVSISVRDNGNGVPKKALDKIFQPFFTTKPSGMGTGLGLSMSYEIITKAHSGELKVDTNEGEGAEFTIILPI